MAAAGDPFSWVGEIDAASLRHHVQYWINLVQDLLENADGRTIPRMPVDGLPFRDALIPPPSPPRWLPTPTRRRSASAS